MSKKAATSTRVVDVFLQYLKEEGTTVVFGIPGGLLHPFFEAVEVDEELELVVTKHEEGAAFMADGFARNGKRLAVCAGTSGPGATNLLTGVACAFADGVPLLVLTGQASRNSQGKGAAQETTREDIDIVSMFRPITKYSTMVTSPEKMPHHLRRALRRAFANRPGPVHLNVPVDIWEVAIEEDWFAPATYRTQTHTFDRRAVQSASEKLLAARHPAILVGAGVATADATDHLCTLAELLPARVATTPRGKGLFPEDHDLSTGVLGLAGHRAAKSLILGDVVDVLLTVGASLNETTTFNWQPELMPKESLIQLDIDADRIGRNYPVDIPLVGDAQTIVLELVYHLHRQIRGGAKRFSEWESNPPTPRGNDRYDHPELRARDTMPLSPQRWRVELQEVLPSDAVIFSDIGGHMLFNLHDLEIKKGQRFVLNLGFGSMGNGTVAPIGAAMANPDRPVIAIVGDACFTMNGMDLITAHEYDVPVVWIIENNNMHGITWHASDKVTDSARKLQSIRYRYPIEVASIARAMGLTAWVVDRPDQLAEVVPTALESRAPTVIEVRVDPEISPPLGVRARSLAGFISDD